MSWFDIIKEGRRDGWLFDQPPTHVPLPNEKDDSPKSCPNGEKWCKYCKTCVPIDKWKEHNKHSQGE